MKIFFLAPLFTVIASICEAIHSLQHVAISGLQRRLRLLAMTKSRVMKIFFALCLLVASPAYAYVGPGPGLSMLGSALGFIAAIGFALLVVIAYPLRLLYLKLRKRPPAIASDKVDRHVANAPRDDKERE